VTVRVQRRAPPLVAGGMVVALHPACPAHVDSPTGQAACTAVLPLLDAAANTWWVTPAGNLITAMREVGTLLHLDQLPLLPQLLHPDTRLRAAPEEVLAALPVELSSSSRFLEYLHTQFDGPQVEAIHWAASHLLTPAEKAAAAEAGGGGPEGVAIGSGGRPKVHVPFTLIQGPPGTGKTHTVLGVLNAWHLTEFQRFYTSLDQLFREESRRSMAGEGRGRGVHGKCWLGAGVYTGCAKGLCCSARWAVLRRCCPVYVLVWLCSATPSPTLCPTATPLPPLSQYLAAHPQTYSTC
jgi:hypothetical protein